MKAKKMTINIAASLIAFAVQFLISFVLSPYIVSKLGEEAYGFVNLSNNFVSYASLLAVAINSMAARFISVEYNQGNTQRAKKYFATVFWANTILSVLILSVALILIFRLENVITISDSLVSQVKLTFVFSFVNLCVSLVGTVYTSAPFATNNMHYVSIMQIIGNFVKSLVIVVLFFALPPKIYFLSFAVLLNSLVLLYGNYRISKKLLGDFNVNPKLVSLPMLKQLAQSGVWMLLSNVSNILLNGFDLLLTNQLLDGFLMGRLSLAKQIPLSIANVLGYFSSIFNASITKSYAEHASEGIVGETKSLMRVLALLFTVPYAGLIVYGADFLKLWLGSSNYTAADLNQIYLLLVIVLVDIIVSTYMYSIHSVFIALDKVKVYSMTLLCASILSVITTTVLVTTTELGVYAIAGTSTCVLGVTHGILVPIYAAKLLKVRKTTFLVAEARSWAFLFLLVAAFAILKRLLFPITGWMNFLVAVAINAVLGYLLAVLILLNKEEKQNILGKLKDKVVGKR